ncbi:MAG: DUF2079 domain-containing protein, partial [Armatimonadota bacterium]
MNGTASRSRASAPPPATGTDYRLTSRDLGACVAVVLLFALPVVTQLIRESVAAVLIIAAALGTPAALAILLVPAGAAAYFIARSTLPWGWKGAACVVALIGWALLCKYLLAGQVALDVGASCSRLLLAAGAALIAVASFKWGRDRHLPYAAGAIGVLSLVVALRQLLFGEHISDVYLFQQGLWTTLHGGGLFHVSDEGGSHFGTHWSPILFALLPLYAVWPSAVPLLILQSAAMAAAAFPVHAILRRTWPEGEALALAAGLLLLPAMLGSTLWQFHEVAFGVAAFLAALMYFERGRPLRFALFAALALLVKESFVVPVALFSLYAAARRRGWRWVVLPAVGAAAYGAVTIGLIMPHFRTEESGRPFRYLYGYLGQTPTEAARYLASHPGRAVRLLTRGRNRIYLEEISKPYGYVVPLGASPVIFGAPDALAVILAQPSPWPMRDPTAHYSMLIAAALLVAFGSSVSSLKRRLGISGSALALAAG